MKCFQIRKSGSKRSRAHLRLGARAAEVFFVNAVRSVNRRMEKSPDGGRIPVVGFIAHSLDARDRKVGAHRRDSVGAAACVERGHSLSKDI